VSQIPREELGRLLNGFEHTAYRLELLPAYEESSETAALASFIAGREPDIYPGRRAWLERVRAAADADKVMQRVHVVAEPLSDYLRFEIGWAYGQSQDAGEDIRILQAVNAPAIVAEAADYWLFDSRTLVRMEYDNRGRLARLHRAIDPGEIVAACYTRDAALHYAVPYDAYVARQPQLLRAS
jgi:hypothetical protein